MSFIYFRGLLGLGGSNVRQTHDLSYIPALNVRLRGLREEKDDEEMTIRDGELCSYRNAGW